MEYSGKPYADNLLQISSLLRDVDIICGFNLKYDLAWLKRYGLDLSDKEIWDCQLCEFLLSNQSVPFPSLADACSKYGLPPKSDVVATEYWNVGVDTPLVPYKTLTEYLENDLRITDALYQRQLVDLPEGKRALLRLQNQDLLVLLDMEYNGIRFDIGAMGEEAERVEKQIVEVESALGEYTGGWPHFNFDSGDHLSALLYGGTISVDVATPHEIVVKSGPNKGKAVIRNRWEKVTKSFPRLVDPLDGSELKKSTQEQGFWSVEESTLKQLKADKKAKKLIESLLKRSALEKYLTTYLIGIPAHLYKYDWQDGIIHGTINQCRVVTGRLSSERPNQQNFPDDVMKFIVSRS